MPRLSPLQWLIVVVFQVFYGFAVFALTRDHYQRRPAPPPRVTDSAPAAAPRPVPAGDRSGGGPAIAEASLIPESVVQNDPVLLAQLGDERFAQRRYQEAIDIYQRVLEMKPDDVDTHNDLGLALHYSGNSTRALEILKKGARLDPDFQRIWLTLGFVQLHTAERPDATVALQIAIRLGADNQVGQEAQRLLGTVEAP